MRTLMMALILLTGCHTDANGKLVLGGDTNTGTGGNDGSNSALPPSRDPDMTVDGDLATGAKISLTWANNTTACFPGNENVNFNGNNVIATYPQPAHTNLYIEVDPDKSVDVSVYALAFPTGQAETPPDVSESAAYRCEAGYDQKNDSNPGENEYVLLEWDKAFDAVIGVAGANGATTGKYTLKLWTEPNTISGDSGN